MCLSHNIVIIIIIKRWWSTHVCANVYKHNCNSNPVESIIANLQCIIWRTNLQTHTIILGGAEQDFQLCNLHLANIIITICNNKYTAYQNVCLYTRTRVVYVFLILAFFFWSLGGGIIVNILVIEIYISAPPNFSSLILYFHNINLFHFLDRSLIIIFWY